MKKIFNNEVNEKSINEVVELYGWVSKIRNLGGLIFIDLRDRSGIIQLVVNPENEYYELASTLKNEYVINVIGKVVKREKANLNLETGNIEVIVDSLNIINTSEELPIQVTGEINSNEDTRLKYRYLDLRRESLQKNIIMRSKIMNAVRNFLVENKFLEIETPILCKSTPEGARDYIVPSRVAPGNFYALPQSPQIFKQLLMLSGFERYFQIAKCFRDEDLRADRQPEFTQIDLEMSFANDEDIMTLVENMLKYVVKEVKGIDLYQFPRMTWADAMENFGSDKPDTRFDMRLNDLTEILENTSISIFKSVIDAGGLVKCLVVKNSADKYSRKDIDNLTLFVKKYGAKGMAWLKFIDNEFTGSIKTLEPEKLDLIKENLNIENNDLILIVADKKDIVYASLGALRLKLGNDLNLIDKEKFNFLWVVDFPMFEYSETENRYKAMHHPFTKPKNIEDIENPENVLSVAYDIVLNGYELGGGSVRIHEPKLQKEVFDALGLSEEDIKNKFGFFIDAFKYGAPPHAGLAIGLERFTMLMSGTDNIKDVIAFPKTQSASDLMSEAPSSVSVEQLKELGIKLNINE